MITMRAVSRHLWAVHSPLTALGAAAAVLGLLCLAGLTLDPRLVTGAPVWLKPLKFSLSFLTYSWTLVWLLGLVQTRRRWAQGLGWVVTAGVLVELGAIVVQAARGTPSHFNQATPFDALVWSLMGQAVVALWCAHLGVTALLLFERITPAPVSWALRLGLLLSLLGMTQGILMTFPSAAQQAVLHAGGHLNLIGAHTVGTADGGPGLPGLGWSTRGGDLRVGHFLGLHALQLLPLFALLLGRVRGLHDAQRLRLVWTGAAVSFGLILLTTWQALRGEPLTAPQPATLAAAGLLLVGGVLSATWSLRARP